MTGSAERAGRVEVGAVVAGRYEVARLLGRGSSAEVYLARQRALGRDVALKILALRWAEEPRARARFVREATAASAFRHPRAVAIHELGEHDGRPFLAMELVDAPTLRAELAASEGRVGARPVLAPARALGVVRSIADVLAAAHEARVVHRDLKPENVFVEPSGEARVADFGLAFVRGVPGADRMTADGVVEGTPAYLSPEQARGGEVGPATDVYALGCVLVELLTGAPPFEGPDLDVLTKQLFAAPPSLAERGAALSSAHEDLVAAMLRKRPDERPTASAVLARAGELLGSPAEGAPEPGAITLGVIGELPRELALALAASGVTAEVLGTSPERLPDVVFAPGLDVAAIAELARRDAPVLTDAAPEDGVRLRALVAAGVADVLRTPVDPGELSKKARAAVERWRRRKR